MKFATIVSGSSGNCVYIEGGSTRVLVDAGLTLKSLKAACKEYGCEPTDFAALLITHEHNDHISGAERIWRRFGVPLWASVSTWENLPFSVCFAEKERHMFEYGMNIGELKFDFFRLSHDSVQPVGIIDEHEGRRLAIATDTGCVTPSMAKALDLYINKIKRGEEVSIVEVHNDEAKEEFIRVQQNKLAKKSRTRSTSTTKSSK